MTRYSSHNPQPITWLSGHAIYTAHVIAAAYVASMIVTALLMALKVDAPFAWLGFASGAVWRGEIWRLVSYAWLNPPSLWFVIDMFLLAWFGSELEKFFGRRAFLMLFAGLYLVTPLLFTALGPWWSTSLLGQSGAFGLFIAYVTLHPGVSFFLNLQARWIAWILLGIYSLIHLSRRDAASLLSLWATAGFAFVFVRQEQGALSWPRLPRPARMTAEPARGPRVQPRDEVQQTLDRLLDKIARDGVHSLTAVERAQLEEARRRLLQRRG